MRAQQAHVKVTSPAKAHSVNTSAIAKHGGRLRMESARLSIPYRGTHEREVLEKETPHPTPDISTSVTSPMIWSWYALRKGAINPRHAWHAAPTADGPPPLGVAVARSRRRDTTRVGRLIFAARAALSSRVCLHLAKTAQRRQAAAARYPTPLRLIPRHYKAP